MSWVAVGIGVGGSLIGGAMSAQGAQNAADTLAGSQQNALSLQKQFGLDAETANMWSMILNRQAALGPMQTQLTFWNALQQGLGAPGYGVPGQVAGPGGAMIPGGAFAPGAAATPSTVSPIQGNTFQTAAGPITLPPGFDYNQVFGPVSSAQLNLPSGFTGSLTRAPSATDIQALMNPEMSAVESSIMDQLLARGAATGMVGGGGLLSNIGEAIAPVTAEAWQTAENQATLNQQNLRNFLLAGATGNAGAIQGAGSLTASGGENQANLAMNLGTNLGQTVANIGGATAQGQLGQTNAWSNMIQNIAGLGMKGAQSQTPNNLGGSVDYSQYYPTYTQNWGSSAALSPYNPYGG